MKKKRNQRNRIILEDILKKDLKEMMIINIKRKKILNKKKKKEMIDLLISQEN